MSDPEPAAVLLDFVWAAVGAFLLGLAVGLAVGVGV